MHFLTYAARRLSWLDRAGRPNGQGLKHALGCMVEWANAGRPEVPMHPLDMTVHRFGFSITDFKTGRVWPLPRLLREGEAVVAEPPHGCAPCAVPRGLRVVGYIHGDWRPGSSAVVVEEDGGRESAPGALVPVAGAAEPG